MPAAAPSPADIPHLEVGVARDSSAVPALLRLGAAYREAGRHDEARMVLERAERLGPANPDVALYLGLTYEELDLVAEASRLYSRYLASGRSRQLRSLLQQRLMLLERQTLRLAVRDALAREASLSSMAPSSGTVAVFPFLVGTSDERLRPLGRALAEMLTNDLGTTGRLRVLERAQVQVLLDEMRLAESGYMDQTTAAQSGRILGAGRIVQGQTVGDAGGLRLNAVLVDAVTGETRGDGRMSAQGALAELFEMQRQMSLRIHEELGVQLTAQERERLGARRTENLEALLAFGLGLEAWDAGRYGDAAAQFRRAAALDPGFQLAQGHAQLAGTMAVAAAVSTGEIAAAAAGQGVLGDGGQAQLQAVQDMVPTGARRDAAVEVLGQEGFTRQPPVVEVIIRRPGGG
jgi:TolB-like protein